MGDLHGVLLLGGIMAFLLALGHLRRSFGIAHLLQAATPHTQAALTSLPPVSVLAPCCGVDHAFEAYARALLSQDYPRYEVLFLVESTADPAWEVLSRILATTPEADASLLAVGTAEGCSQKLHNLRVGLAHMKAETTVLAFVDSDAQVHAQWLQALARPLDALMIGATSGFRWYIPCRGSLASSLRSAWNAATLGLVVHPRFGFAWGGSSAIRRELFDRLGIGTMWSHGLSDDLLLTQAVRTAGLRIAFVAAGLVPTYEPCTWPQLLEWTNRQATIARVYMPYSWGISLLVHFSHIVLGLLLLLAFTTGQWLAGGLLMSQELLHGFGSMVVCRAARDRLIISGYTAQQSVWAQALWGPVVTVLASLNIVVSLMRRTITWRGIRYTMLSPQHTVVHHGRGVPASSSHPSCRIHHKEGVPVATGRELLRYVGSTLAGRRFNLLIFFVTSRCNAKCDFCFYWDHLNHAGDLTLEEIRQISATMPRFQRLLFSGGETFMRHELVDIVTLFHQHNGVATINLPTNGILQRQIVDKTAAILDQNPALTVNVGFSLDGFAATHDRVRGVPGCFGKALASLKAVTALRDRFPNLTVFVNSVILYENYAELPALAEYLLQEVDLDTHYFNIIRGDPQNPAQRDVPHEALANLYQAYEQMQAIYVQRSHQQRGRGPVAASLWRTFYLGRLAIYNDIQFTNYTHGKRWPMPCTAGETAAVIDYNGDVRICELRQPIGNLREYDCDFSRLWNAPGRTAEVAQMRRDQCDCTHICFIDDSATYSPKVALLQPPVVYAQRQWENMRGSGVH